MLRDTALAFVTLFVKDDQLYSSPAVHPHGQVFCKTMLSAFKDRFFCCDAFSAKPSVAFPRGNSLIVPGGKFHLEDGSLVENVPYLNVTPFKQMVIGCLMVHRIVRWGWRHRLRKHRIVFSFNLSVPPAICTLLAAWLTSSKAVVFLGDISLPGVTTPNSFWHKVDAFIQHRIVKYFDGHIVVADCMAHDFFPGKAYVRVEGGVSEKLIERTGACLAERTPNQKMFTIIATGSLETHNGFEELIAAFQMLKGDHYRLWIAGRGVLQPAIEYAAKKDSRIRFYGYLQQDDLLRLHAQADILINMRVSKYGKTIYGFPSKTLEYMLSGIPVITTCIGHIEEEFSEICYLLKDETASGLSLKIRQIEMLSPMERMAMGRRARDYMCKHKSWTTQCEKILDYLQQIVA